MHGSNSRHGGALLELHTGSDTFVRPSMGSWITYGLGTENQNLPGFITICPTLTHGGVNNYSSAFLPAAYQGTPIGNAAVPAEQATIPFIKNTETPRDVQRLELDLLDEMNREHLAQTGPDAALEGRIDSFELAFRMQSAAPELQDISSETHRDAAGSTASTIRDTENFGRQCLMARRFAERGVRFVQVTHSYKWDQHDNLKRDHANNAAEVDRPIAGLLDGSEAARPAATTRWSSGAASSAGRRPPRDATAATTIRTASRCGWPAAASRRPVLRAEPTTTATTRSRTRSTSTTCTRRSCTCSGLDHTKLTYRYAGRDFRLTDVAGEVVTKIIA